MAANNNIIGEVGLKVVPIDPGFDAAVKRIIDRLENQAKFKISADTNDASKGVDQLIGKTGALADKWAAAGLQVAGFTAAIYIVRNAVDSVIDRFAGLFDQLSQAKAGFTSILGSVGAGNQLLDQIREFARVSPFVTQELVNYSQQLLGVGVASEKIVPLLTRVGDIISSVGGDTQSIGRVLFTLTQIQTIGRLTGQDAMQLQSALIPITKYLAEYLHKTTAEIKKMQEAGSISAETVFSAISSQGDKVQGAMNLATRTIGAAKSVLFDTIKIFLTSQPVLNKINQDIIKGILAVSNALSDQGVQSAFTRFFDGVNKIYDALTPFLKQLASLGSEGGLTVLDTFSTILETVAVVLDAIPEPVLRLLATTFATLSILKAPLALLKYVDSIKTVTVGLFSFAQAQIAGAAATDAQTEAIQRQTLVSERNNKILRASALALGVAGALVSDGQGGGRDAVGTVLTGAAVGASVGGLPGALAGGAAGAVTAIFTANAKADEDAKKASAELAKTYADEFNKSLKLQFGETTPDKSLTAAFGEINSTQTVIDNITKSIDIWKKKQDSLTGGNVGEINKQYQDLANNISKATDVVGQYQKELDALKATDTVAYLQNVSNKLALVDKNTPGTLTQNFPTDGLPGFTPESLRITARQLEILNGALPKSAEEVDFLRTQLGFLGLTFDAVIVNAPDQVQILINKFTSLPDSFKDASIAALNFGTIIKKSATDATELFGKFKEEVAGVAAQLAEVTQTNQSFGSLFERNAKSGVLGVRKDITNSEINAVGNQLLTSSSKEYERAVVSLTATLGSEEARKQALIISNRTLYGEFRILQDTLGKTDSEFKELLKTTGLYNAYSSTFDVKNSVNVETLDEMASRLGIAKDKLADLLQLSKTNSTTQIISTKETDKLIADLKDVNTQIENFTGHGNINGLYVEQVRLTGELAANTRDVTAAIKEQEAAQLKLFDLFSGQISTYLGGLDRARTFNDVLGGLFEVTNANTLAITTNVDTIANAATVILSNAAAVFETSFNKSGDKVAANAAAANTAVAQFEALQITLGKTDKEFRGVLESLQLLDEYNLAVAASDNAVTGTLADVAKQLGISQKELFELTGLLGAIDPTLNIVVTADTAKAVERLKELDKMLSQGSLGGDLRLQLEAERTTLNQQIAAGGGVTGVDPNTQKPEDTIRKENERKAEEARRSVEKAAREAQQKAEEASRKAAAELERWKNAVENATASLTSKLEQAAASIVTAAQAWVTSIKERTQYEQAVSTSRLTNNADKQAKDLIEISSGLANLRGRGISQGVLDSLGINNVADTRQVRKLVGSSNSDLARLNEAVSNRDNLAQNLATSEEDRRTRANITQAIKDAAKTLNIDLSKVNAAAISNQFNITPGLNAEDIAAQILNILSSGRISR